MSLKLSHNGTPPYDYLSEGSGANPAASSVVLTQAGGTLNGSTAPLRLVATEFRYTDIELTVVSEESGVNWQLSLDNSTWADTIEPADMNALSEDQVTLIYARPVVDNDGSLGISIKTAADIQLSYRGWPE